MKNTNEFLDHYPLHIAYSHLAASTISSEGSKTRQKSFEATQSSLPILAILSLLYGDTFHL